MSDNLPMWQYGMRFSDTDQQRVSVQLDAPMQADDGTLVLYGRMGVPIPPPEQRIGARITADSRCTRCGKPFLAGHAVTADLKPNMAGTARHTDCDDPKLENVE